MSEVEQALHALVLGSPGLLVFPLLIQICITVCRLFSIDPPTARDLDDALSIEELPGGNFRVGVHIADVAHFIRWAVLTGPFQTNSFVAVLATTGTVLRSITIYYTFLSLLQII